MDSVLGLLGLAQRANKLLYGENVYEGIKGVRLLFLASDASVKTSERLSKKARYYQIPLISSYTSKELSAALGKKNIKVLGVKDAGFAASLQKKYKGGSYGETDVQETL